MNKPSEILVQGKKNYERKMQKKNNMNYELKKEKRKEKNRKCICLFGNHSHLTAGGVAKRNTKKIVQYSKTDKGGGAL